MSGVKTLIEILKNWRKYDEYKKDLTKLEFAKAAKKRIEEIYDDVEVTMKTVTKNNGVSLTGIAISVKDKNETPIIYIDKAFCQYKAGKVSMEGVIQEIVEIYESSIIDNLPKSLLKSFYDFDKIKDKICFRLVNKELNLSLLEDTPHIIFQNDLAVIFYILVKNAEDGIQSITIKNSAMALWDIDTMQLYDLAAENTRRIFGIKLMTIGDMLGQQFLNDLIEESPMYVATNNECLFGANIMLYNDVLEEFADKIGMDFYIIPSSVHECIFVPLNNNMDVSEIIKMIFEVNTTAVADEEVLSYSVYIYTKADGQLTKYS